MEIFYNKEVEEGEMNTFQSQLDVVERVPMFGIFSSAFTSKSITYGYLNTNGKDMGIIGTGAAVMIVHDDFEPINPFYQNIMVLEEDFIMFYRYAIAPTTTMKKEIPIH